MKCSRTKASFTSLQQLLGGLVILLASGCAVSPEKDTGAQTQEAQGGIVIAEKADFTSQVKTDFDAALAALKAEQYPEAIELLKKVTKAAPNHTAPLIDLAMAYRKSGDLDNAESTIKEALKLNPTHPVANTEYGLILRKTGRFEEARKAYEAALAAYPEFLPARKNLGIVCDLYMKDVDCALTNYRLYLQSVPNDKSVQIWVAELQRQAK